MDCYLLVASSNYEWSIKGTRRAIKSTFNPSNKRSVCLAISNEGVVASTAVRY